MAKRGCRLNPTMHRAVGLVMLAGFYCTTPAPAFGPGPDMEQVRAEEKKLEQLRAETGDHAFGTFAIANLRLIAQSLPRWHPAYDDRVLQVGTGEYLNATRPYFARVSLDMLGELNDKRALQVLEMFMALHARDARTQPNGSRWMILSWHDYERAAEAYLRIRASDIGLADAIIEKSYSNWAVQRVVLSHMPSQPGLSHPGPVMALDDAEDNALIKLTQAKQWNVIEALATLRAFDVSDAVMGQMLKDDRPAVRVAAAFVLYHRDVQPKWYHWREGLDDDEIKAMQETEDAAIRDRAAPARQAIGEVWRALIDRRRVLDEQVAHRDRKAHAEVEMLDHCLDRLLHLAAFTQTDAFFMDHIIDGIGWTGAVPWLQRAIQREGHTPTDQQWQRLIAWLDHPLADEYTLRSLATMLIQLDHAPAADPIVRFYNRIHVLDGLDLHPRYLARIGEHEAPEANQQPAWLAWLKQHATQ